MWAVRRRRSLLLGTTDELSNSSVGRYGFQQCEHGRPLMRTDGFRRGLLLGREQQRSAWRWVYDGSHGSHSGSRRINISADQCRRELYLRHYAYGGRILLGG